MDADTKRSMQFYDALAWLDANRQKVAIAALVLAALVVVYLFWDWRKDVKAQEANKAIFALDTGLGANRPANLNPESYLKVASEYQGTPAGEHAALLAAGALFDAKKFAEAHAQFDKFLKENAESPLAAQAAYGVAASLEAQGKVTEAITKYKEVTTRYGSESVGGLAKLSLARLYEKQNQPEEALRLYDDLTRAMDSTWGMQARQLRADLLEAHPNLVKVETPAVVATTNMPLTAPTNVRPLLQPTNP